MIVQKIRSRLEEDTQFRLIDFFVLQVSARKAAAILGIEANSSALFYNKLRIMIAEYFEHSIRIYNGYQKYFPKIVNGNLYEELHSYHYIPLFRFGIVDGLVYTKVFDRSPDFDASTIYADVIYDGVVYLQDRSYPSSINYRYVQCSMRSNHGDKNNKAVLNFWQLCEGLFENYNNMPAANFDLFVKECEFRFNLPDVKEQRDILVKMSGLELSKTP